MAKVILARALVDVLAQGVCVGDLVQAPSAVITELAKTGAVDTHKDAVAYAKEQGARVVDLKDPKVEEERAALQASITELTEKLAAAPEADKKGVQAELDGKLAALKALD